METAGDTESEMDEYQETQEVDPSRTLLSRPLPPGPRNPGYMPIRLLRIIEAISAAANLQ